MKINLIIFYIPQTLQLNKDFFFFDALGGKKYTHLAHPFYKRKRGGRKKKTNTFWGGEKK